MIKTKVNNSYELNELLMREYGERIKTDPLVALQGCVEGTFDAKKFNITFKGNEYLLISTNPTTREVIDELLPILIEVMGGEQPIVSYDLLTEDMQEGEAMPTIEWDLVEPEKRIKEIVNDRAFNGNNKILNLKLYNSKDASEYLETEQEKEERIKNARIYGVDPGSIADVEKVKNMSELDLYLNIDALGGHIWWCEHQMAHNRIDKVDLTEERYALEFLVYQTTRFGVELEEPAIDKHVSPTPSYRAWYLFYDNHFKHELTTEQWNEFLTAHRNKKDVSAFMPTGSWKDLLEQSLKKVKKS